MSDQQYEKLAK